MKIIETISDLEKVKKGCVLTIGNFDGVHLGHQAILAAAGQIATQKAVHLTVLTFEPHPVAVLHPEKAPGMLTPIEFKKHLLAKHGVDCLIILKDSPELLSLSPAAFVEQFLVKSIQPRAVVEGEDFNFGSGRTGSVHTLYNLGVEKGFEVTIVDTRQAKLSIGQSVKISSTLIRNLIESGNVSDAAVALSRPYRLIGPIIPGRGKGKQLGFPTLNMKPPQQIIPADGVYAGLVRIGDSFEQLCEVKDTLPAAASCGASRSGLPAAFSIGRSATLGSNFPLSIEAHLLTENIADSSGRWMAMDFIKHIRHQQKFKTESELAKQIANDCETAKNILKV